METLITWAGHQSLGDSSGGQFQVGQGLYYLDTRLKVSEEVIKSGRKEIFCQCQPWYNVFFMCLCKLPSMKSLEVGTYLL